MVIIGDLLKTGGGGGEGVELPRINITWNKEQSKGDHFCRNRTATEQLRALFSLKSHDHEVEATEDSLAQLILSFIKHL